MTPDYPQPITSVDDLPKNYDAPAREPFWQQYWAAQGTYKFQPRRPDGTLRTHAEIFSIDTPPPTVSGNLHIGHVYSYTQTDMNARYRRMAGKHVFYPFGFDDNGLPTERLVEKEAGKRAHEMSREDFIKLCQETAAKYEAEFIALWQSLALSCDWEQYYTTIDERSRAISQASFIDLYNKGYIYREYGPTQWDWVNQTAIAQAEIEDREVPGHFNYIKFQWADGPGEPVRGEFVIGTTRPELIPACVAVMANPESEQLVRDHEGKPVRDFAGNEVLQRDLIGKIAITPLFEVEVPILPSEKADPEKGTGVLMCCTFGDMDDVEHWKRDWPEQWVYKGKLRERVIIDKDGRIEGFGWLFEGTERSVGSKEKATVAYYVPSRNPDAAIAHLENIYGQKINKARGLIVDALTTASLLLARNEIVHTVRFAERGDVAVEILTTPQWYVRILENKEALLQQGNKICWHPSYMRKRFEQWVSGLNADWCISRQRYNGVPFPVWYTPLERTMVLADMTQLENGAINPLIDNPKPGSVEFSKALARAHEHGDPIAEQEHQFLRVIAEEIRDGHDPRKSKALIPDLDVMDTWATSSVTMLLNTHFMPGGTGALAGGKSSEPEVSGQSSETPGDFATGDGARATNSEETLQRHAQLFPYDMRPQAHDIIRTWAFYTIAKAYFHFGEIPWKDIVISGHAQDASRAKMSKSKGNTVTPAQMVEKYSADGLRYWSGSVKLGTDTVYDETKLGEGRKLINKLFNATKFALRHLLDFDPGVPTSGRRSENVATVKDALTGGQHPHTLIDAVTYPTDLWLISRLNACIEKATAAHEAFEFGDAKQAIEDFFWADLCDNYLEFSKGRLYGEPLAVDVHGDADALRRSAQATLYIAFSGVLRMLAPALPHITEECWSWYFAQWSEKGSIHLEQWPTLIGVPTSGRRSESEAALTGGQHPHATDLLIHTVSAVRKWKSERGVSIKTPLRRVTIYATGERSFNDSDLAAILGDLLSTCNAQQAVLVTGNVPDEAVTAERNPVAVMCEIAEQP